MSRGFRFGLVTVLGIRGAAAQQPTDSAAWARALASYQDNRLDSAYSQFETWLAGHPRDVGALTWFAETARRTGHMTEALGAGRQALALEPCSGFAHSTLGAVFNPQYSGYEETNPDSAWAHMDAAARCDPDDGNVWIPMWVEGIHRGDPALEERALARLVQTGFLTAGVLKLNRWVLTSLPPGAILFTAGDLDTYPARALQVVDNLRPDVGVINLALLNLVWYARHIAGVNRLPIPFPDDSLDRLAAAGTLGTSMANAWRQMAARGTLGRPLAIGFTAGQQPDSAPLGKLRVEGPYRLVVGGAESADLNPSRVATLLDSLKGADFAGAMVSATDRSPVRRAGSGRPGMIPLAVAGVLIRWLDQEGAGDPAQARRAWAERFASEAGIDPAKAVEVTGY